MADERDYRLRLDLVLSTTAESRADEIKTFLSQMLQYAINSEGWAASSKESAGYLWLERCGHRLNLPCETIGRWEVGKGRII